jgi:VWFA-related protein
MTARPAIIAAGLVAGTAVLVGQGQRPSPPKPGQTFRSSTDVVMVDVSVRDNGRPVTGLTAADFVVTDNGVRQQIESVEAAAVPIDVTLVMDVSGNPRGPWAARIPPAKTLAAVEAEARQVTSLLRPDDRVRLLAIDTYMQQLWPLQPVAGAPSIRDIESNGLSALYDTLAVALLQPVEPARRHVVIARTKGRDTISAIGAAAVRAMAERSDVLFHLVMMEQAAAQEDTLSAFQCGYMGLCWPTRRPWVPFQRRLMSGLGQELSPDGQALSAAAQSTQGDLHLTRVLTVPSLVSTFTRAFDDFRSSYVLRYTPRGEARAGWHAISVTVPKFRRSVIRARTGYGIDDPAPARTPPPVPASPRTLAEFTNAYERRAYPAISTGLRQAADPAQLIREFVEAGNPWPSAPRREATFAIELAEPAVFSPRAPTREEGDRLLDRFSRLIRHPLEPDEFERVWYYAVLTQFEGALRPAATEAFADRALARFPDEPRFLLAKAIAADQRLGLPAGTGLPRTTMLSAAEAARAQFDALLMRPEVADEARLRLARLLQRLGRTSEAVTHLTDQRLQNSQDPSLRFLQRLFLGHGLVTLNRPGEAVDAFRSALTIIPAAHSARVALMNTLLSRGDRDEAEALAEQVQTERSPDLDPWWMYWQGQYRLYPQVIAYLRGLAQ